MWVLLVIHLFTHCFIRYLLFVRFPAGTYESIQEIGLVLQVKIRLMKRKKSKNARKVGKSGTKSNAIVSRESTANSGSA